MNIHYYMYSQFSNTHQHATVQGDDIVSCSSRHYLALNNVTKVRTYSTTGREGDPHSPNGGM